MDIALREKGTGLFIYASTLAQMPILIRVKVLGEYLRYMMTKMLFR